MRHFSTAHTCGRIRYLACKANRSSTMEERMMNRLTVKQGVERSYKGMHALQIPLHFGLCLKMLLALAIAALAHTTQVQAYDGEYQLPQWKAPHRCTVEVWTASDKGADTNSTIDMLIWFKGGHTYRWRQDRDDEDWLGNEYDDHEGGYDYYWFGQLRDDDGLQDADRDEFPDSPTLNLHSDGMGKKEPGWLWDRIRVTSFKDKKAVAAWEWYNTREEWIYGGWHNFGQGTSLIKLNKPKP